MKVSVGSRGKKYRYLTDDICEKNKKNTRKDMIKKLKLQDYKNCLNGN